VVVGIGGEWVRRMWAAALWALGFREADDQPAARNPGVLRTELFTLMSRSPIPSLMVDK
jgi:hypothetical protein